MDDKNNRATLDISIDIKITKTKTDTYKDKDLYLKPPQYSPCIVLFTHQKVDTEYLDERLPKILIFHVSQSPGINGLNIQFELS